MARQMGASLTEKGNIKVNDKMESSIPGPSSNGPPRAFSAPSGDGPVAVESPEVVDTHGVVQCGCTFQPLDPPCKPVF